MPDEPAAAVPAEDPSGEPSEPATPWYEDITPADGMEPDPRRFCKPNLYALGVLCNIVYEDINDTDTYLSLAQRVNPGYTAVETFDKGNAQAAIFDHPDFITLAFRGTSSDDPDDGSDWSSNLEALMEIVEILHLKGRVHTGFWKYADLLWEDTDDHRGIGTALKEMTDANMRPIMIAGHSLGGAAAVLAAMRVVSLYETDEVISQLCTFGQPRCVGHRLAKVLTDSLGPRYCRVVKGVDVVPMVPPSIGYAHAGVLYHIHDNKVVRNPNWFQEQWDRLWAWWNNGGGWFDAKLSFVEDHDMTNYWHLVRDAEYEHEQNALARRS